MSFSFSNNSSVSGPKQCDEDDYGYESQEASKFYNKMMEKYNAVPVEEKKSYKPNNRATAKDLVNTKVCLQTLFENLT